MNTQLTAEYVESTKARILSRVKVDPVSGCWLWQKPRKDHSYGHLSFLGRPCRSHRVAYTLWVGAIPEGAVLDHVASRGCTSPLCCNPEHLEPVNLSTNTKRSYEVRFGGVDVCAKGHDLTVEENVTHRKNGQVRCLVCGRERMRELRAAKKAGTHTPKPATELDRLLAKTKLAPNGRCRLWTGAVGTDGYGRHQFRGKGGKAHRAAYELLVGPIPAGFTVDHLCKTPLCVNKECLEAVTNHENILRSGSAAALNARKTHCPQDHAYDEVNTYHAPSGRRGCKACRRSRNRAASARRKTTSKAGL
ncbi:HNH endonuclease signature motif containing protein [Rhodococcus sp. JS3073]|uniref:HNH endonuclease signature motif containing protein n=1 Tax=Rhodococcus sp. JS3073 TaxID=3002901 RepID=UPI0022854704|nr:HNH endonuclease [Rhodococcus sp. JS3073]WAM17507.1 HNH endonuclease [Rhodococcus sp. JS3073]